MTEQRKDPDAASGHKPITEADLAKLQIGTTYPRTFEEIAAMVEAGRDIGWYAEQFLVDEVRRLRDA